MRYFTLSHSLYSINWRTDVFHSCWHFHTLHGKLWNFYVFSERIISRRKVSRWKTLNCNMCSNDKSENRSNLLFQGKAASWWIVWRMIFLPKISKKVKQSWLMLINWLTHMKASPTIYIQISGRVFREFNCVRYDETESCYSN